MKSDSRNSLTSSGFSDSRPQSRVREDEGTDNGINFWNYSG